MSVLAHLGGGRELLRMGCNMHPLPFYLPEPGTGGLSSCIHLCHPPNASATPLGPSRPQTAEQSNPPSDLSRVSTKIR